MLSTCRRRHYEWPCFSGVTANALCPPVDSITHIAELWKQAVALYFAVIRSALYWDLCPAHASCP